MDKELYDIIKRVYVDKDFKFFIDKCNNEISFLSEIINITKLLHNRCKVSNKNIASLEISFLCDEYKDNIMCINFKTILRISKIANVYFLTHEFELNNPVDDKVAPTLFGTGSEYIREQFDLEDRIVRLLRKENYKRIKTYYELDEIISENLTLEKALFQDPWKLT